MPDEQRVEPIPGPDGCGRQREGRGSRAWRDDVAAGHVGGAEAEVPEPDVPRWLRRRRSPSSLSVWGRLWPAAPEGPRDARGAEAAVPRRAGENRGVLGGGRFYAMPGGAAGLVARLRATGRGRAGRSVRGLGDP